MLFGVEIIEELEKLDPQVRSIFIKILRGIEVAVGEVVKRVDFLELKEEVEKLAQSIRELAEAQKRTEERIDQLAEAQRRTEERINQLAEAQKKAEERLTKLEKTVQELAEAQRRTEERVNQLAEAQKKAEERLTKLEKTVQELAEAQKRTEERVNQLAEAQRRTEEALKKLTEEHRKTREHLGGLSHSVGYILENQAYRALPELLRKDFGLEVRDRLKRDLIEVGKSRWEEINIIGRGLKDGEEIIILGEAKTQLKKKDVDSFVRKVARLEEFRERNKLLICVTHQVLNPEVIKYATNKGVHKIYFSYELD
ncbi:hypothetical protein [Thermodesulforhabdus norvegica]|uniref:Chordopoxvirus fusion protein n=1 Tax=Thermodesulforhabdus norvegica TaxID=39841 RepID=A0A1I4U7Y3_9BACT|nr:hypothetical protein [Thermodesulforhabdus norvegica]SFM85079.1 hypothetical protein SAMN05660836_01694 [Thermodesulforhabdus norvegica]